MRNVLFFSDFEFREESDKKQNVTHKSISSLGRDPEATQTLRTKRFRVYVRIIEKLKRYAQSDLELFRASVGILERPKRYA